MPAPEVQFVLNATRDNFPGGKTLPAIPLERIDRDNSDNLDRADAIAALSGPVHEHSDDLQEMNFIGVRLVSRPQDPSGTNYNLQGDTVLGVRVEGAHVSEGGAIDPQNGTADAASYADWNTTDWDSLTNDIRRAILNDSSRKFPSVGRKNTTYKDLFIENWEDQSANYADYYRLDFDVRLTGFEDLP